MWEEGEEEVWMVMMGWWKRIAGRDEEW